MQEFAQNLQFATEQETKPWSCRFVHFLECKSKASWTEDDRHEGLALDPSDWTRRGLAWTADSEGMSLTAGVLV